MGFSYPLKGPFLAKMAKNGYFCIINTNDSRNFKSCLFDSRYKTYYCDLSKFNQFDPFFSLKRLLFGKNGKNGYFCIININDSRNLKRCFVESKYKTYYCNLSTFNRFDCFLSLKMPFLANLSKDGYFCTIETNDSRNLKCCSFDSKYRTYYCNLSKFNRFDHF